MRKPVLVLSLVAALAVALPAQAGAAGTLQPGAYHETDAGGCTLSFAYTGGATTYLGTAAHCSDRVGQEVRDQDGERFGTIALRGNPDVNKEDYAFIAVDAEDVGRVRPAVKGHPTYPRGVTTHTQTAVGDQLQLSGYGVGFGSTQPTQEQRRGTLQFDDADEYTAAAPLIFGDSGGPIVHIPTGRALGIVSRLCVGLCTEEGPTVEGILAKAAARGLSLTLRTG